MILAISNDGPLITATNYWEHDLERRGLAFVSLNARAFRVLLPRSLEITIPDMATGRLAVVSVPRNPCRYAMEIMLDDGSESPYCLHLSAGQIDHLPARKDDGRDDLEFTVWTRPRRGEPHEALRRPAAYRSVTTIPWLKPW
jgi:hypothetical protein